MNTTDGDGLKLLQHKLATSQELCEVLGFFLDRFANREDFLRSGRRYQDTFVETMVKTAATSADPEAKVTNLVLVELPEYEFVHGALLVNGCPTQVIYFQRSKLGLLAISDKAKEFVQFCRFSAQVVPDDWSPNNN